MIDHDQLIRIQFLLKYFQPEYLYEQIHEVCQNFCK